MVQGGTFKAGFASGFTSSFFSPGTSLGGAKTTGGFTLRTTIAAIAGGTASSIGGGKFANGAVSGAFVHMFNAEGLLNAKRNLAWDTDGNSKLSLSEARQWYQNGNGKAIDIDGSRVNIHNTGRLNSKGGEIGYGAGEDYLVHGQVSINPNNGRIYYGDYDFEMHGNSFFNDGWYGLRNGATALGRLYNGSGKTYTIRYRYD